MGKNSNSFRSGYSQGGFSYETGEKLGGKSGSSDTGAAGSRQLAKKTRGVKGHKIVIGILGVFLGTLLIGIVEEIRQGIFFELGNAIVCIAAVALMVFLIMKQLKKIKFKRKYEELYPHIKDEEAIILQKLEDEAGLAQGEAIKILAMAVKQKYIRFGQLCKYRKVFIISDRLMGEYIKDTEGFEEAYIRWYYENDKKKSSMKKSEELIEIGKDSIYKIRESNALIDNPEVSAKLEKTERLVSLIFDEAVKHPEKADNLGMFMNYYLPTTKKILKTYADFEAAGYDSESAMETKKRIEGAIDNVNTSFENILDKLYQKEADSVAGEISALEAMMRQEGLG